MKANDLKIQKGIFPLLEEKYSFKIKEISFIPIGEESFAYKVVTDNRHTYFIKYCEKQRVIDNLKTVNELLLQIKNLDFVISPIVSQGQTSFNLGPGQVYIFSFVEGEIIKRGNETFEKEIVSELTRIMVQIHKLKDKIKVALPVEDFDDNYQEQLEKIKAQIRKSDGYLIDVFEDNEMLTRSIIKKQESEAKRYKQQKTDFILTHGDITGRNIIRASDGLKLVDWDGAMFAPAEKDIIFYYDNPNFSLDEYYRQMSRNKTLFDYTLMEYYRRQWAIETILGNFQTLLVGVSDENRREYLGELNEYLNLYR